MDWTYAEKTTVLPERIKEVSESLDNYRSRFVSILKGNTSISDELLNELQLFDQATFIEPTRAKEMGIVHEVQQASVTTGEQLLNVEY